MKKLLGSIAVAGLLTTACSEAVEFNAVDADGLAAIVDAGITEESGLKGLLTSDVFSIEDVAEFNELAVDACTDLSDGISSSEYNEFESGVLDGAEEMEGMIDAGALTVALIDATCPSYTENLSAAMAG